MTSADDWRPTATWETLRARADLLKRVRSFFDDRGLVEVETPALSRDTVVDLYIDPFGMTDPGSGDRYWLQTSPEFHMKRLLAAGGGAMYQISRVFRREESGPFHNPEFTMVEWYVPGHGLAEGIGLLAAVAKELFAAESVDIARYRDAFAAATGLDAWEDPVESFDACARREGVPAPETLGADRDGWLNLLFAEVVQPKLGAERPVVISHYPPSQAALAETFDDPYPAAGRFELFYRGVELANGYRELLDADELRRRNAANNATRASRDADVLPESSRLLEAMDSGLPACAGVALGFDRVVMVALGKSSIQDVVAFPWDRA
ncbi:MAG TPA: EF-P lysine aminoacylase EpmA [Pirellulaceae bacterium]|jgi:lysyl-tRNA synthetase class 2|nr:EF-P lysine aminoacylase EpmA [Pirellulaceae bacterium]